MTPSGSAVVGWIGAGAMGRPMVEALLDAALTVRLYDINPKPLKDLAARGATVVDTVRDTAVAAQILGIAVQTSEQVNQCLFTDGTVDVLSPGSVVIVFSTIGPAAMQDIADRLRALGIGVVDAPMSGGPKRARGRLTIMAAGDPDDIARASPVLNALSEKLFHVGAAPGAGQVIKSINQLLAGVHIVAAAEAMALAKRAGVDLEVVYQVITQAAGNSWMFTDRAPRMIEKAYEPSRSDVRIFIKDLGIVEHLAQAVGAHTYLAREARVIFERAAALGLAASDDSAVIEVYESGR